MTTEVWTKTNDYMVDLREFIDSTFGGINTIGVPSLVMALYVDICIYCIHPKSHTNGGAIKLMQQIDQMWKQYSYEL